MALVRRWPRIGLFVPLLLLLGNTQIGVSASLRATCAAVAPGPVAFFRYDWTRCGVWNVVFAAGLVVGGLVAIAALGGLRTTWAFLPLSL